ncbi:MAG TPA: type II secretion system protein F, partial [Intrasporangium sp.]|uniref:type II secretion system F family protein n=1 Tax=Intrasporangium sp. TaxID=1925024 RepID=UPI002FA9987D
MSPSVVGLILGAGVFCIYWSFWPKEDVPADAGERRRAGFIAELRDHLHQAGYATVTPTNVLVGSVVLFVVAFLAFLVATDVLPIALCFGLIAAATPISLIRMRARKQRSRLRDLWPDAVDNITSGVRAGLALPEAL